MKSIANVEFGNFFIAGIEIVVCSLPVSINGKGDGTSWSLDGSRTCLWAQPDVISSNKPDLSVTM